MLEDISSYASTLLPIFAGVLLILLIILVARLLAFMSRVSRTVDNVEDILQVSKNYLIDIRTTISAVNNVSMSVEAIRVTIERLFKKYYRKAVTEVEEVKAWVRKLMADSEKEENATTEVVVRKEDKKDDGRE